MFFAGRDLRYAVRSLGKSRALPAVAVASLAVGIGVNVTAYSVFREMILRNVSAREPDRLVRIGGKVSYAMFRELRVAGPFQDLAFNLGLGDRSWQTGAHSEVVWSIATSANFFDVLGVRASMGRLYSQSGDGPDAAVVSYGFWRRRLHASANAIGQPLQLNGRPYTVVGVLPSDYLSIMGKGVSPEVYLPAGADFRQCSLFGRLRDGRSIDQTRPGWIAAAERLGGAGFARQGSQLHPMSGLGASAAEGGDEGRFFVFFAMLYGVAALMALIACANVAGLLLARGMSRQREMAVRKALGANRLHLARPLLAEGFLVAACGTGGGLLLDAFLRRELSYLRWPSAYGIPFEFHFHADGNLFWYAAAAASVALLASSALPVAVGSHADLGLAMKQGEPAISAGRWNLRSAFVALQVTLAMALLTLGALFTRSFVHIANNGPGFDTAHTVIAAVHPLNGRYAGDRLWEFRQRAVRRVEAIPGVVSVTSAGILPLMGEIPGTEVRRLGEPASALRNVYTLGAGDRYFAVLGIPILRGRDFEIADRERKPIPVVINQTLAGQLFGVGDPIGAVLLAGRDDAKTLQIIGVATDSKMRTLGENGVPAFFQPDFNSQLLVRVAGKPGGWIAPLASALSELDATAAVDVRPLEDAAAGALFPMRVASLFVGALSGIGLSLALIGLYASVSYSVRRRRRETGIRLALGATPGRILRASLQGVMGVVVCGTVAGTMAAAGAIRSLTGILPDGVNPWDPLVFGGVAALLVFTGMAAAWFPTRRAARVDPVIALRQD